jgi:FkbM family methyltransferase
VKTIYHPRGFFNALFREGAWHLREFARNPAYRALHQFARTLKRSPSERAIQVTYAGRVIELLDGPSFLSAWDEIFVNRIYDIGECHGRRPVLVDAGANIGLAALYWKVRYIDFEYLGFEPDPVVAQCCRTNLDRWGVRGQLVEAAVSNFEGDAAFLSDGADGGRLGKGGAPGLRERSVRTIRLAPHLPRRVDLLKIDVEGAEASVLVDVASSLGGVGNIFVEWHSKSGQPGLGRAIDLLEAAGFDCHIQVAVGESKPFQGRGGGDGYYQNLNIFAVRS